MLANSMELRHLRYFIAVAEEENVSRAALKLHVSQPAVSRQIRDLEEELGFLLLERAAKSVRLTPAGRVFFVEARAVLQRADEAVRLARATSESAGELHIGYAGSPTARILPPALRAFQAELPKVRVKIHDLSTEEMLARLREQNIQLAFLVRPTDRMLRGLAFEELTRISLCLAVPPRHRFARQRTVTLAEAASEPFVAFSRTEYPEYHEYLAAVFAGSKEKPHIVDEHDSVTSLIASVEAGSGVALVPESFACLVGPRLKVLPLAPAPEPFVLGVAFVKGKVSPLAARFLESARAAAADVANAPVTAKR